MDDQTLRLECLKLAAADPDNAGAARLMEGAAAVEVWVREKGKDNVVLRLECLKVAIGRHGARDPRPLPEIANQLYSFCIDGIPAEIAAPSTAEDKPGTPADDAAPAGTPERRRRRRRAKT